MMAAVNSADGGDILPDGAGAITADAVRVPCSSAEQGLRPASGRWKRPEEINETCCTHLSCTLSGTVWSAVEPGRIVSVCQSTVEMPDDA